MSAAKNLKTILIIILVISAWPGRDQGLSSSWKRLQDGAEEKY